MPSSGPVPNDNSGAPGVTAQASGVWWSSPQPAASSSHRLEAVNRAARRKGRIEVSEHVAMLLELDVRPEGDRVVRVVLEYAGVLQAAAARAGHPRIEGREG